jgi:hypothetical protein
VSDDVRSERFECRTAEKFPFFDFFFLFAKNPAVQFSSARPGCGGRLGVSLRVRVRPVLCQSMGGRVLLFAAFSLLMWPVTDGFSSEGGGIGSGAAPSSRPPPVMGRARFVYATFHGHHQQKDRQSLANARLYRLPGEESNDKLPIRACEAQVGVLFPDSIPAVKGGFMGLRTLSLVSPVTNELFVAIAESFPGSAGAVSPGVARTGPRANACSTATQPDLDWLVRAAADSPGGTVVPHGSGNNASALLQHPYGIALVNVSFAVGGTIAVGALFVTCQPTDAVLVARNFVLGGAIHLEVFATVKSPRGIAATNDGLRVIVAAAGRNRVYEFDALTGERLAHRNVAHPIGVFVAPADAGPDLAGTVFVGSVPASGGGSTGAAPVRVPGQVLAFVPSTPSALALGRPPIYALADVRLTHPAGLALISPTELIVAAQRDGNVFSFKLPAVKPESGRRNSTTVVYSHSGRVLISGAGALEQLLVVRDCPAGTTNKTDYCAGPPVPSAPWFEVWVPVMATLVLVCGVTAGLGIAVIRFRRRQNLRNRMGGILIGTEGEWELAIQRADLAGDDVVPGSAPWDHGIWTGCCCCPLTDQRR